MRKKILTALLAFSLLAANLSPAFLFPNNTFVAEASKKATKKKAPSIKKIYNTIVKTFGDNYLADMPLTKEDIKARYGLSQSWYTDIIAEVPMMSAHVDTLVIAKAKNKNTKKKIKNKLTAYRQGLINDTMQYPMNLLKIQASKVYVKGDYVFFIMLSYVDSNTEETSTEEQVIEAYKAENQKAVDAINALFK